MSQAELESLIERSGVQAQTMTERAQKSVEALLGLEGAVTAAESRLQTDVAATRERIAQTLSFVTRVEAEIKAGNQSVTDMFKAVELQKGQHESQLSAALDTARPTAQQLARESHEAALLLSRQLEECRQSSRDLRQMARSEVGRLRKEATELTARLASLNDWAEKSRDRLDGAVNEVSQDYDRLEGAISAELKNLVMAYEQCKSRTRTRLSQLEEPLKTLATQVGTHLDGVLVQQLANNLRQAANGFHQDLSGVERSLASLASNIGQAHDTFQGNLKNSVQPGLANVPGGLHAAADQYGMFG